jgi:hypothetical protein
VKTGWKLDQVAGAVMPRPSDRPGITRVFRGADFSDGAGMLAPVGN